MMTAATQTNRAKLTDREVESLIKALNRIETRGRRADYDLAKWAQRIAGICGLYSRKVMVEQLKLEPSQANSYLRRLEDLEAVPDQDVWVAANWTWVRKIAKLDRSNRAIVATRVLEARNSNGITSQARIREILAPFVATPARTHDEEQNGVARALEELKYLVETYDLPGYVVPDEVADILNKV